MGSLGGWEIIIIIGVLVLLFGAKKLPDMARSIGQTARVFKGEMKGLKSDDEPRKAEPAAPPHTSPTTAPSTAPPSTLPPVQPSPVRPGQQAQQDPKPASRPGRTDSAP